MGDAWNIRNRSSMFECGKGARLFLSNRLRQANGLRSYNGQRIIEEKYATLTSI